MSTPRPCALALAALVLAGISPVAGCARRQSLVIVPATMTAAPSPMNRTEGEAFVMREERDLMARVKFSSVHRWKLIVTARAEPAADGTWPQLRVAIDGNPGTVLPAAQRAATPYSLTFVAEPGCTDLALALANAAAGGKGPTIVIDRVEIVPL